MFFDLCVCLFCVGELFVECVCYLCGCGNCLLFESDCVVFGLCWCFVIRVLSSKEYMRVVFVILVCV